MLTALAAQLAAAVETPAPARRGRPGHDLAQANDLRAALLQAVSHDLRTPLASIKASISSLRQPDVTWSSEQLDEFHATIEEETDRLDSLVANLLDMSRIQAGACAGHLRPVALDEVVPAAVAGLGPRAHDVDVETSETLPPVARRSRPAGAGPRQPGRQRRVRLAPDRPVRVEAGAVAGRVDIRVVDQGPGIPRQDRDRVFQPFQRLVDHGVGRRARAWPSPAGSSTPWAASSRSRTRPGGGATMVVSLPDGALMQRVLVVDDEPPILRALATNLRARGYDVDLAADRRAGPRPRRPPPPRRS